MTETLPCPWCGQQPRLVEPWKEVWCDNENCQNYRYAFTFYFWNARAEPTREWVWEAVEDVALIRQAMFLNDWHPEWFKKLDRIAAALTSLTSLTSSARKEK